MKKSEISAKVLAGELWLLCEVRKVDEPREMTTKTGKKMLIAEHRLENLSGDPVQLTEMRAENPDGKGFRPGVVIPKKGTLVALQLSEMSSEYGRPPYKVTAADLVPVEA